MLNLLFSFRGRISRRQYWRGLGWLLLALPLATVPGFVAAVMGPFDTALPAVAVTAFFAFVLAGISSTAMAIKRAHDLGQAGRWLFSPFAGFSVLFVEGEPRVNRYGPIPVDTVGSWRTARWIAGLGLASTIALCLALYRDFAGPTWSWPDCRPAITAEGGSMDDARDQWHRDVAAAYGPAYAYSGISIVNTTTCRDGVCRKSGRPCVRRS